jgi:hypothetical protein
VLPKGPILSTFCHTLSQEPDCEHLWQLDLSKNLFCDEM